MHIIIEGIDKSGKTTLALELARRLYMPIINRLPPKKDIYTECMDFLTKSKEDYIVDRFHLSELAYGPVKRGSVRFSDEQFDTIEEKCKEKNTINIYCSDSLENITKRCVELNEDFIIGDEIEKVWKGFEYALSVSALTWHRYTIGDSIDELVKKIVNKI